MINIVNYNVHCDDKRRITAVDIKLKSFKDEGQEAISGHPLIAVVSAAFYQTTLLTDSGVSLTTTPNTKRKDIVDLSVVLDKNSNLSSVDIGNFIEALQKALDETKIF